MTRFDTFIFLAQLLSPFVKNVDLNRVPATQVMWCQIVDLAHSHLVSPALKPLLLENDLWKRLPTDLQEYLSALNCICADTTDRIRHQAYHLIKILNQQGVEPVLMKGVAHIFMGLYAHKGMRMMNDIDVLLPQDTIISCAKSLIHSGYRPLTTRWGKLQGFPESHHLPRLIHPDFPVGVELHRKLIRSNNNSEPMNSRECLLKSSRLANKDGIRYKVMLPEDHILYHIIHQFVHLRYPLAPFKPGSWLNRAPIYNFSLKNMMDYALLSRQAGDRVNWDVIQYRLGSYGCALGWRTYAEYAKRLMAVPIPEVTYNHRFNEKQWYGLKRFIRFPVARNVVGLTQLNMKKMCTFLNSVSYRKHLGKRLREKNFYNQMISRIKQGF